MIERDEAVEQLKDLYERKGKITNTVISDDEHTHHYSTYSRIFDGKKDLEEAIDKPLTNRNVYDRDILIRCLKQMEEEYGYVNEYLIWSEENDYPTGENFKIHFNSVEEAIDEAGVTVKPQEQVTKDRLPGQLKECYEKYGEVTVGLLNNKDEFHCYETFQKEYDSMAKMQDVAGMPLEERSYYNKEVLIKALQEVERKKGKVTRSFFNSSENNYPTITAFRKNFDSFTDAVDQADVESDISSSKCKNCGEVYNGLSRHWREDCKYPEITEKDKNLFRGLLMGDGWVSDKGKSKGHRFQIALINKRFLEYLSDRFDWLFTDVYLTNTGEQMYEKAINPDSIQQKRGDTVNKENYHNIWKINSFQHSFFTELREWYSSGEKRYPDSLELTPVVLRGWYVTDGGLRYYKDHPSRKPNACFFCKNENDRTEFIIDKFNEVGFEPRWNKNKSMVTFSVEGTKKLMSYMDCSEWPFPGFEYKSEINDIERYEQLMQEMYDYGEIDNG